VRAAAMLDQIDRLPGSECQFAVQDRDMQRACRQHGLDVRRHIVGTFGVVAPTGVLGREPAEHRHEIVEHGGIGILLDRQRRRSMADEQRHRPLSRVRVKHKLRDLGGEIDEAGAGGLNREKRRHDGVGADGGWRGAG